MAHAGDIVMPSHSGPAMVNIYKQNQLDEYNNAPQPQPQPQPQARHRHFRQLRRDVAALDGQLTAARLPLGVDSLDSALAGGLALGRVHMLCGRPGHDGALTGFAVALLRRILTRVDAAAPIVWCPAVATGGSGMLHAAGLAALGLDPGRLLIVDSPSPGARLAALEDILRTEGLAAVIVEYDGVNQSSDYWMRLARRAQLAAEASGVTGLLLGWLWRPQALTRSGGLPRMYLRWMYLMRRHPLPRWRWRPVPGTPAGRLILSMPVVGGRTACVCPGTRMPTGCGNGHPHHSLLVPRWLAVRRRCHWPVAACRFAGCGRLVMARS